MAISTASMAICMMAPPVKSSSVNIVVMAFSLKASQPKITSKVEVKPPF